MILDLLSPTSYIMVNRNAINLFGLNTAAYMAELLSIYKKVIAKEKFVNAEGYFKVDRNYVQRQTSLSSDEQLKCDINLSKVNIINIDEQDVNTICLNVEVYASLLAEEDIKVLTKVSSAVKVKSPRGAAAANKAYQISATKNAIECKNIQILAKLYELIDSLFSNNKYMSAAQAKMFKKQLDDYCDGDVNKGIAVINEAIASGYTNCEWAISSYERNISKSAPRTMQNTQRTGLQSVQRRATAFSSNPADSY